MYPKILVDTAKHCFNPANLKHKKIVDINIENPK